uniref:Uncharacterized protein n=1 Tax=Panagrolaimus superbus TaxID=310955 RepID=A0A914YXD3_9BILA
MQKEMIYKAVFVQKTYLSLTGKTIVCFGENLEFTVGIQKKVCETFCVENIKGDLEITKITSTGKFFKCP